MERLYGFVLGVGILLGIFTGSMNVSLVWFTSVMWILLLVAIYWRHGENWRLIGWWSFYMVAGTLAIVRPCSPPILLLLMGLLVFFLPVLHRGFMNKKWSVIYVPGLISYLIVRKYLWWSDRTSFLAIVFYVIVSILFFLVVYPRVKTVYSALFFFSVASDLREFWRIVFFWGPIMFLYFKPLVWLLAFLSYLPDFKFSRGRLVFFLVSVFVSNLVDYLAYLGVVVPLGALTVRLFVIPALLVFFL